MSGTDDTTDAQLKVNPRTNEVFADTTDHDGVIPEPGRGFANILWLLRQLVLGLGIVWLLAVLGLLAFQPDSPKGTTDTATLVATLGLLVNAFMVGYQRRQG